MTALVKYDAACRALAEAKAVDEVKDLRDKAEAMRIYAMQAKNKTLEVDAAEIRIRAERRLGEMITHQKETVGLNTGAAGLGINQHNKQEVRSLPTTAPTLADVGISKDLSSRAQKLAAVPEEEFETEVGEWRERVQIEGQRVTTRLEVAGAREIAKRKPVTPPKNAEEIKAKLKEAEAERCSSLLGSYARLLLGAIQQTEEFSQEERDLLMQVKAALSQHNL
ncbi:hypothetical protein [Saezia sanguinis]|uniref:hypothetical protein n=1 Tax=Saezia sanguinis TaxID=1965230 RepID=UPI00304443BB